MIIRNVTIYVTDNTSHKICLFRNRCIERTRDILDKKNHLKMFFRGKSFNCNCLQSCDHIHYYYSKTASVAWPAGTFRIPNHTIEEIRNNFAVMNIYFSSTRYPKITKKLIYLFNDLLANTGGLLGLFVGFSLLSAVELFFYMFWLIWKSYLMNNKINNRFDKNNDSPIYPYIN
ncbi:pickpocket protein 28-like [Sitophilus oryzae]|uniref:Pickpocket protein 28-like n=1 Tax=Sitophilus oryzae TaxID=7048 RepID=A0A6J2X760_SITOR|nr:pickpocket protein 28-like [Sitophilus oryzae]XP_030746709.1 pickpocket protein 28-like [Sitophilus oryzae]